MGKWLNGARVRKREIDGKDTRIAALAAPYGLQIGKLPTFKASKQYEFDVYNGAWIVQEVVTQ